MFLSDPLTYNLKSAGESWSYSKALDGTQRFEVRAGDFFDSPHAAPTEQDEALDKNRSEVSSYLHLQEGRTFVMEFDVMIEPGAVNTADWLVLAQLHQTEDRSATGTVLDAPVSPPLALQLRGETMVIVGRTEPDAITTVSPATMDLFVDTAPIQRGVWYGLRFEMVFDDASGGNGQLRVWRNGAQIVDYEGPLGYNDLVGPYMQFGVYRDVAPESIAARFRDVTLTAVGSPPPMNGTSGHDVISANAIGFWENEVLNGFAGNDTLDGGYGADTMNGGSGDDVYVVNDRGDRANELVGSVDQGGKDVVRSWVSYTILTGIEELNLLGAGALNGTGNAAANALRGTSGQNLLVGMAGDDSLFGYDGADTLRGDAGNDRLEGGAGADTLEGGTGNDLYIITDSTDLVRELAAGGTDTLRSTVSFNVGALAQIEVISADDPAATLAISLTGSDSDNTLRGNAGRNRLAGMDGADVLWGYGGDDSLLGGDGADVLYGDLGNDIILGGTGADTLWGGIGIDSLSGEAGNDVLYAGAGAGDLLAGGAGDDLYVIEAQNVALTETAGEGFDTVRTSASLLLAANAEVEVLRVIDPTTTMALNLRGALGNTELRGNNGANDLDGGVGADTLYGYLGNDTYHVDNLADRVVEPTGQGVDTVITSVSFTISSTQSIEILRTSNAAATTALDLGGNADANAIWGNAGANRLSGGGGDDLLTPGLGNDTVYGGLGNDRVVFGVASTAVSAAGASSFLTLTSADGSDVIANDVELFVFTDRTLTYAQAALLRAPVAITGTAVADVLTGTAANDRIQGLGGNDWLTPGAGSDTVDGGTGIDMVSFVDLVQAVTVNLGTGTAQSGAQSKVLIAVENATGSASSDVFFGNGAENTLRGMAGNDLFHSSTGGRENYDGGTGSDTVSYASAGISSSAGAGISATMQAGLAGDAAGDVYVGIENLTGSQFRDTLTGDAAGNVLQGLGGDDFIFGGAGADLLSGGDGMDRLYGGAGNDLIDGGAGSDFAYFNGSASQFTLIRTGSFAATVTGTGAALAEGADRLTGVEYFVFSDQTVTIWQL